MLGQGARLQGVGVMEGRQEVLRLVRGVLGQGARLQGVSVTEGRQVVLRLVRGVLGQAGDVLSSSRRCAEQQ